MTGQVLLLLVPEGNFCPLDQIFSIRQHLGFFVPFIPDLWSKAFALHIDKCKLNLYHQVLFEVPSHSWNKKDCVILTALSPNSPSSTTNFWPYEFLCFVFEPVVSVRLVFFFIVISLSKTDDRQFPPISHNWSWQLVLGSICEHFLNSTDKCDQGVITDHFCNHLNLWKVLCSTSAQIISGLCLMEAEKLIYHRSKYFLDFYIPILISGHTHIPCH